MSPVLAGISAFRFYRVPPQVLGLLPPISQARDVHREGLYSHPLVCGVLGLPLSCLARSRAARSSSRGIDWQLVQGDLPFGSIVESDLGLRVANPGLTLLTMGRKLTVTKLALAAYEMTGYFSVFEPPAHIERMLADCRADIAARVPCPWRRVIDSAGRPTNLWQRKSLVEIGELLEFSKAASGIRGAKKLERALSMVNGVVASPLEAQVSALLTFPKAVGGCGLVGFENNRRIELSSSSRAMAAQGVCYVDLFHEGVEGGRPLSIECQGMVAHASNESVLSDADRLAALQRMGHDVLFLTSRQLRDANQREEMLRFIAERVGQRCPVPDARTIRAQNALLAELFSNWTTLFDS